LLLTVVKINGSDCFCDQKFWFYLPESVIPESVIEASRVITLGSGVGAVSLVIYDALFKSTAPDEYKKIIRKLSVKDIVESAAMGTVFSLPIALSCCAGSWPIFHAQDLIIPAVLGIMSTSTAVGLKIKELKGFLEKKEKWEEVQKVLHNSNVVFSTGLSLWSLYNRYAKSHQV